MIKIIPQAQIHVQAFGLRSILPNYLDLYFNCPGIINNSNKIIELNIPKDISIDKSNLHQWYGLLRTYAVNFENERFYYQIKDVGYEDESGATQMKINFYNPFNSADYTTYDVNVTKSSTLIPVVTVPEVQYFIMGASEEFSVKNASPPHTVHMTSYQIGTTEISYRQWIEVYNWAINLEENIKYNFKNSGTPGNSLFYNDLQPVVGISFRDAVVWCNAASEMEGLIPCYYNESGEILKNSEGPDNYIDIKSGSIDNPLVKWGESNGYRLPTEAEWELAARFIENSEKDYNFSVPDKPVGLPWEKNEKTNLIGRINSLPDNLEDFNANYLGIYDMSGNIKELCYDWFSIFTSGSPHTDKNTKGKILINENDLKKRVIRGGSVYGDFENICFRTSLSPDVSSDDLGFRIARYEM